MVSEEPLYDLYKLLAYCRSVVETERDFAYEWGKKAKEIEKENEGWAEASVRDRSERTRQQYIQESQRAHREYLKWKSWADSLERLLNVEEQRATAGVG